MALEKRDKIINSWGDRMSGRSVPKISPSKNRLSIYIYAVFALCITGILGWLFFSPLQQTSKCVEDTKKKKIIKQANIKTQRKSRTKPIKTEKIVHGMKESQWKSLTKEERIKIKQKEYDEWAAKQDSTYMERKKRYDAEIAARPFKFASENEIANIISLQPGDDVLLADFHDSLQSDFIESLKHKIIINDDDSEEVKLMKEEMILLKPKLKAMIDKGENLGTILNDYRLHIAKVQQLRENLETELKEIRKNATSVQEVYDFVDAANKMLENEGASHIELPMPRSAIRRIERNAAQNLERK